jgi:pimeloyl-ACP methyl ester carboxylesterase
MTSIWKLLIAGVCLYAVIVAFVYYRQSSLIYYPDMPGRNIVATPERIGLEYQNVQFVTGDKVNLHGWFIPHRAAKGTLLFFHGNAGNISHRLESIEIFHRLELNVFILDYRGYGQSEGRVSEQGTYRDAEAAWNYLIQTRGARPEQVIIFGRSLGASIASWLARKHTPAGLIIESGFSSVPAMAKRIYPFLPVSWLTNFKYDTNPAPNNSSRCAVVTMMDLSSVVRPMSTGSGHLSMKTLSKRNSAALYRWRIKRIGNI